MCDTYLRSYGKLNGDLCGAISTLFVVGNIFKEWKYGKVLLDYFNINYMTYVAYISGKNKYLKKFSN